MADYPISNVDRRVQYVNSGVGPYLFAFEVLVQTDIAVYRGSTLLTLTSDYTVTINANGTGSVTLTTGGTGIITIVGARAIERTTDFTTGGDLFANVLNQGLDSQTIFSQQLAESLDRTVRVPEYTASTVGLEVTPEANGILAWDSTGANLINLDPAALVNVAVYATAYADVFVGDGSETEYTLSRNPGSLYNLDISVDGVTQEPVRDYTLLGTVVTFTSAMPINSRIVIKYKEGLPNVSGDSQDIRYLPAGTGAQVTNVQAKLRETVSVKDFGATGDGTTDDATAIQAAIEYVCANKLSLYFPKATYAVGTTLLIPQNFDATFTGLNPIVTIDGNDSAFKMLSDITLFESAYYNAGVLTSNFGTTLDSHYSVAIVLQNFSVITPTGTQLVQPVLKIQDWHYGCVIRNIKSGVNQQMMFSANNYSTMFDTIQSFLQVPIAGARFVFSGNHNLNKISNFVAANSVTAYRFDGPVTACQITNMSVEGCTYGFAFNATVYDVNIENCYFEGFTDTGIVFSSYVDACLIQNNYVAFNSGSYFVSYPSLPGVNVIIAQNNSYQGVYTEASFVKTVEAIYGAGIVVQRPSISTSNIADLIIDNALVSNNVQWEQPIVMPGILTKKTNIYAVGQYAGKYSEGYGSYHGFTWTNLSSGTIQINTKMLYSQTLKIYVNIVVEATATTFIKGEFIGGLAPTFYEYGVSGVSVTTALNITNVGGFVQINGTVAGTITAIAGEIRLI